MQHFESYVNVGKAKNTQEVLPTRLEPDKCPTTFRKYPSISTLSFTSLHPNLNPPGKVIVEAPQTIYGILVVVQQSLLYVDFQQQWGFLKLWMILC